MLAVASLLGGAAAHASRERRLGLLAVALALVGLVVGQCTSRCARSQPVDVSPRDRCSRANDRHRAVAPRKVRRASAGVVTRFAGRALREPVQLKLPLGRAPPQGAILEALVRVTAASRTEERVRRTDVASTSRRARRPARRPLADRRPARRARRRCGRLATTAAELRRARAERLSRGRARGRRPRRGQRAVGRTEASLPCLRALSPPGCLGTKRGTRRRAASLLLAWLLGAPRLIGQLCALVAICAYVLAVGAQPSVIRAGVAGALGCLAWLTARAATAGTSCSSARSCCSRGTRTRFSMRAFSSRSRRWRRSSCWCRASCGFSRATHSASRFGSSWRSLPRAGWRPRRSPGSSSTRSSS